MTTIKKKRTKKISSSYRIKDLDIFDRVGKYIIFNDEKISFFTYYYINACNLLITVIIL